MTAFQKNSSVFVVTDDQTLIKEYGESVPRPDQIKKRVSHIKSNIEGLATILKEILDPKVFTKEAASSLGLMMEDRNFPKKNHFFSMEVIRVQFDTFGRFRYLQFYRLSYCIPLTMLYPLPFAFLTSKIEEKN